MNKAVECEHVLIGVTAFVGNLHQRITIGDQFAGQEIHSISFDYHDVDRLDVYNGDGELIGYIEFPKRTHFISSYQTIAIDGPAETK